MGPPVPYQLVTPKPVIVHKTILLPRDGLPQGLSNIMFSDKLAWNQIIR
jgi:hypothetical protein